MKINLNLYASLAEYLPDRTRGNPNTSNSQREQPLSN